MTSLDPDALWRLATQKWAQIEAQLPDLAPAVALQRQLLQLTLDAAGGLDRGLSLNLSAEAIAAKLRRGVPAARNEPIAIPQRLAGFLPSICTALAEGGAGDSAAHIRDAIVRTDIDAISLLRVSLARNQKAVRTSALHMGFAPDLVWLIGELASSPLAHHLAEGCARTLIPPEKAPGAVFQWDRGYCPFCGSWPVFIESTSGARTARCSYCALGWPLSTPRCIYCGNAGADFVSAAPDVSRPQSRVELCGTCGSYTKVLDVPAPVPFPLLAIDDLATMHLDSGAMNRGYGRPELFDIDAIEPGTSTC